LDVDTTLISYPHFCSPCPNAFLYAL
jgi:hypothetical protein